MPITGTLVHVAWNETKRCITGWWYDNAQHSQMPLLYNRLDLGKCRVCTVHEIDEAHAAYKKKMHAERANGTRQPSEWAEWEKWEHQCELVREVLAEKVTLGHMSAAKYRTAVRDLDAQGFLYDEDYDSDLDYDTDEENTSAVQTDAA